MTLGFQTYVGSQRDTNELSYCAALMQTAKTLRGNGTVSSLDIRRILGSRHNVFVSHERAIELVRLLTGGLQQDTPVFKKHASSQNRLQGLLRKKSNDQVDGIVGEGEEENDILLEEYLDLCQLLSLLLIPFLARANESEDTKEEDEDNNRYDRTPYLLQCEHHQKVDANDTVHRVYDILLQDMGQDTNFSSTQAPTIDAEFVTTLLDLVGEYERAQDDELVEDMVRIARNADGKLDAESFLQALTIDLGDWETASESRLSTHYHDAVVSKGEKQLSGLYDSVVNHPGNADKEGEEALSATIVKRKQGNSYIDFVVDSHSSLMVVIAIWTFYFTASITFLQVLNLSGSGCVEQGVTDSGATWGCTLASTVWKSFFVPVFLAMIGVAIIAPLASGNDPHHRGPWRMLVACGCALLFTLIPYFTIDAEDRADAGVDGYFWEPVSFTNLSLGCALAGFYFLLLVVSVIRQRASQVPTRTARGALTSSNTQGEYRTKQAAGFKFDNVIRNALVLHDDNTRISSRSSSTRSMIGSESDKAMVNFLLSQGRLSERHGAFKTFRSIADGSLFEQLGIWIPTRLLSFQLAQIVLCILLGIVIFIVNVFLVNQMGTLLADPELSDFVKQFVPSESQVAWAVWPATIVTYLIMTALVLLYIPSSVSTLERFRSGRIPSLGSPTFEPYRLAVETIYMNFGNGLYATFGSVLLAWFLLSGVIFLFTYEITRPVMLHILAWGIGLSIAIGSKVVFQTIFRSQTYRGFYRTKPTLANAVSLFLECWHIGVGASILIGRITQFLLAAVFWVGRIDQIFLADNVDIMGYKFDYVPLAFIKELLVHDAHRHPYIERISCIALMGLNKESFSDRAAIAWRMIFLHLLFPWMRKHRVFASDRYTQAVAGLTSRQADRIEESKDFMTRTQEDVAQKVDATKTLAAGTTEAVVKGATETTEVVLDTVKGAVVMTESVMDKMTGGALARADDKQQ